MRALVTGFEPFGGETVNPSALVAEMLAENPPDGIELSTAILPVAFGPDIEALFRVADRFQPDLLLSLGQSGGSEMLRLERYAHNWMRSPETGKERRIDPSGPAAYETTLPLAEFIAEMRKKEIPAIVSRDAGDYVCNHLYYQTLHRMHLARSSVSSGFAHLPYALAQTRPGRPGMSLETMHHGIRILLERMRENNAKR